MSRLTMFGRDNFIDKNMITVLKAQEKLIIDEVYKETKRTISSAGIAVTVDRAKLEKWLRFCTQLEHIDKSELIDFAVKKKFTDLEHELEVYKRACRNLYKEHGQVLCKTIPTEEWYLDQARKEREGESSN